jgi:predicted outer membrane protein
MDTSTIALSVALLFALSAPVLASAPSAKLASLFDQANQMNNEEQDMAKELKSKAGDNQALVTMADTIRDDHKDNQAALEALASQKNVTLKSYEKNKAAEDQLDNLKGAQFNEAFLNMEIRDHEKALATFRRAKSEFSSDPDVRVYIDQTIPVLEAHLKMAQNLHRDDKILGSRENAANNKKTD